MDDPTDLSAPEPLKRLVELLLVMVCAILVLFWFVGLMPPGSVDSGDIATAKAQIKQFDTALMAYKIKFRRLPDGLERLLDPPDGQPIMNAKAIPEDPWGTSYLYLRLDTKAYVIVSLGADSAPGGKGADSDIRSDELTNESAR